MKGLLIAIASMLVVYALGGCAEIPNNNAKISLDNGIYDIETIEINGDEIAIPKGVTFNIDGDRIYGNAGCNSYFASFSRGIDSILVDVSGATKMLCANEEDNRFEYLYLQNLNGEFKISGNNKKIKLKNKNMLLILTR